MLDMDLPVMDAISDGDRSAALAHHKDWYKQADSFFRGAGSGGSEVVKARKRFRTKALKWLVALATGMGLRRFLLPKAVEARPRPQKWPILVTSLDQGNDGWAAVQYLSSALPFGIHIMADPSYRCWNDCQLALKDSQTWAAVNLMTVVLNMDSGPWRDARWYQQSKEAIAAYTACTKASDCPVW